MTVAHPFDDFRALVAGFPEGNAEAGAKVRAVFDRYHQAAGSLGRLEDIAAWLATWSGRAPPAVSRPTVVVFAGNHGVVRQGVSPRSMSATAAAVERAAAGGAAINQICLAHDLGLKIFDLALDHPTGDISRETALDARATAATMAFGLEAVAGGSDLLCIGDIGVGNSTVAAALLALLFGGTGEDWVGRGSGADEGMRRRKVAAVDAAIALHRAAASDPLEALARAGGREFAAIAGAIIAARAERVPVILSGLAATAAAAVLFRMQPGALDHCLLACVEDDGPHARAAALLGLEPLLGFTVPHGEGTGAALAAGIVKAAAQTASGLAIAQKA